MASNTSEANVVRVQPSQYIGEPMSLDPTVGFVLQALKDQGVKSFEKLTIDEARTVLNTFPDLQSHPQEVASVTDHHVEGNTIRVYVPEASGPLPVMLYVHGGGWVGGNLDIVDEPVRSLANAAGVIVAATSYRPAPENKFPAAIDDVYASLQWLSKNAESLGGDPKKVGIIGDSAGGNLAAIAAIRARDTGISLSAQVLTYPIIDNTTNWASRTENAEGYLITTSAVDWFWKQYLNEPSEAHHPLASPLKNEDLSNLPPTLVLTTEYDPARDEGAAYAEALAKAGTEVQHQQFDGLIHGVFWMSGAVPRSSELVDTISEYLQKIFSNAETATSQVKNH